MLTILATGYGAASARASFRPRIGPAMGIVAPASIPDLASGVRIPVVYHGGAVMHGVTVHTVFWAPPGFRFDGSPSAGVLGYEPLIQRFFADAAHDSGSTGNAFSTLLQYPDRRAGGSYALTYQPVLDSIDDSDPYPAARRQCPSPAGVATCVTDLQIRQELQRVIAAHDPAGRGLHDLWIVFLPPDVDECVQAGACGTNDFSGYHSLSQLGSAPTIYAVIPDPLIEETPPPGSDPQGNPEAESSIDTAAHETVEAITNPQGVGWMDPNGFEVADKCENPEDGTPLGFAPDGSPFDQVIGGDQFLIQTMWSNVTEGCVQRSASTASALPLAQVDLTQFSPVVSGAIGSARENVPVAVALVRAGQPVALAEAVTRGDGRWGPTSLRGLDGRPHAVSDDRELVLVRYGQHGPKPDVIATGAGGDPFGEAGWTGWFDLDHGYALGRRTVSLAPCGQTGVLAVRIDGKPTPPPIDRCDSESDVATLATKRLSAASRVTLSSEDNRASTAANPDGALVKLSLSLGEPGSASNARNGQVLLEPSGFPTCVADLRAQSVRCSGLVPRARYTLTRMRAAERIAATAARDGTVGFAVPSGGIRGGDVLTLRNRFGRLLTRLHVAHLRAAIIAHQTVLAGGTCQPDDYYGPLLSRPPVSGEIGFGVTGEGTICPSTGRAKGLPDANIVQSDDLSGGETRTEVPDIDRTTPLDGEVLYGRFIAQAQSGLPGPHGTVLARGIPVAVTILNSRGRRVFHARDADTSQGVSVGALPSGAYSALWVLKDANGDTRTIRTGFLEQR